MKLRVVGLLAAGAFVAPQPFQAQEVALGSASATVEEPFSSLQTVRELPDGRVLVADPLGQVFQVINMETQAKETIGRVGQGPREYQQPDAVWPLPDGASLLVDLGNGRLTRIEPDLSFGETKSFTIGAPGRGGDLVVAIPRASDHQGNVFFQAIGMGGGDPDSTTVLRMNVETMTVDTVATVGRGAVIRETSGGANNQNVSIRPVPLAPADAWGVAPDGSVVIARWGDFSVEWMRPDGTVASSGPIPYDPVRLRQAEKEEWSEARVQGGGGLTMEVAMENGSMSMRARRGGAREDDLDLASLPFPDHKPPFYTSRIDIDSEGRAWVRRHVRAGEAALYDVFDSTGERVSSVRFPEGRRLIGFGPSGLYSLNTDAFGLVTLERYDLPF